MLRFASRRAEGESFNGRHEYLHKKVEWVEPAWICHAMEKANLPLGRQYQSDGFPWMTLVLGSGCLEARESSDVSVDDLPGAVHALLAGQSRLPDGSDPARLAATFAESLIEDRLGLVVSRDRARSGGDPHDAVSPLTPDLVLATAVLTRVYHRVRAARPHAVSRYGDDRALIEPNLQIAAEVTKLALEALRRCGIALEQHGRRHEDHMLVELFTRIRGSLTEIVPKLEYVHVRLLTDLSWHYLTRNTAVYPGWSDLLVHLSAQQEKAVLNRARPRPAFNNLTAAAQPITRRYEKATTESWKSLRGGERSDRDRFYETAARLVCEQAVVRAGLRGKATRPPTASVFLTTFDLELEMALWSLGTQPFVVAVPIHFVAEVPASPQEPGPRRVKDVRSVDSVDSTPRFASTCWLGCKIQPDHDLDHEEQLKRLRNPDPDQWFLLSTQKRYDRDYGAMPVVVRLNGCPLLGLPPLIRDGQWSDLCQEIAALFSLPTLPKVPDEFAAAPLDIQHAVLLDEYAAMQQTATEFFNWGADQSSQNSLRYGLPLDITGVQSAAFARFWMVMGMQVGDSGVRYRFTSQMLSPSMGSEPPKKLPDRSGVVINRRINSAIEDLLYWYGFDVVHARSEEFLPDLEHYIKHLQGYEVDGKVQRRSRWDQACPID